VKHALTEQGEPSSAESHALEKLQLVHASLDHSIAVRQGETGQDSGFVSLDAADHFLKFTDLAVLHVL
jgi:hypothetical protein